MWSAVATRYHHFVLMSQNQIHHSVQGSSSLLQKCTSGLYVASVQFLTDFFCKLHLLLSSHPHLDLMSSFVTLSSSTKIWNAFPDSVQTTCCIQWRVMEEMYGDHSLSHLSYGRTATILRMYSSKDKSPCLDACALMQIYTITISVQRSNQWSFCVPICTV
jgi:hypothetical protein